TRSGARPSWRFATRLAPRAGACVFSMTGCSPPGRCRRASRSRSWASNADRPLLDVAVGDLEPRGLPLSSGREIRTGALRRRAEARARLGEHLLALAEREADQVLPERFP